MRIGIVNGEGCDVGGLDDCPTGVLRGIAITASETASDEASVEGGGKRATQFNR
jgi:hypothetical protein